MMKLLTVLTVTVVLPLACAADIVPVGKGSYTTVLPANAREPQNVIYKTENVKGPIPSNDWWSSLAWVPFSECHYPHPLALKFSAAGLRVFYPKNISVNSIGLFGTMPANADDLLLGHTAEANFPDARLDGFSDWFVSARLGSGANRLTITYGHGSPYVYARYDGGDARVTFPSAPKVWSGTAQTPVLGVTIREKHYGLFGPTGSAWSGLGSASFTNHLGKRTYFSLAVLPDNSPATLALFARHAYAHVVDTKVSWHYEHAKSAVTTEFKFQTVPREGTETGTLFALYPHQWLHTTSPLLTHTYASVRGTMKLAQGAGFTTSMTFPGVLPALPDAGGCDQAKLQEYIRSAESSLRTGGAGDTYWEGKRFGKLASLVPIAEQAGAKNEADAFLREIRSRLENWLTATGAQGTPKQKSLFYYNREWGTLIGYPASYGSDRDLNDHHFHYGYFIRAAAELARHDPTWAADSQWGGMVKLLIRDTACPDRDDLLFPFLRNFDPYAGHSWASGNARFADGNNNESSSEAMNAWTGLILWGEATGDTKLCDLGLYLFTTEMEAINCYWFDVTGQIRPPQYKPSVVTMVWGGKSVNETWFSSAPEMVHGINWLPIHGGSLYLGLYPDYVQKNYDALVAEKRGAAFRDWVDLIWMYRALQDPQDALRQFNAAAASAGKIPQEAGNSVANTYHWICNLNALGQVDRTVTADYPVYAVFRKGPKKAYTVYNYGAQMRTVTFSDGTALNCAPRGFTLTTKPQ